MDLHPPDKPHLPRSAEHPQYHYLGFNTGDCGGYFVFKLQHSIPLARDVSQFVKCLPGIDDISSLFLALLKTLPAQVMIL